MKNAYSKNKNGQGDVSFSLKEIFTKGNGLSIKKDEEWKYWKF